MFVKRLMLWMPLETLQLQLEKVLQLDLLF
jgi:hypothetical protein